MRPTELCTQCVHNFKIRKDRIEPHKMLQVSFTKTIAVSGLQLNTYQQSPACRNPRVYAEGYLCLSYYRFPNIKL